MDRAESGTQAAPQGTNLRVSGSRSFSQIKPGDVGAGFSLGRQMDTARARMRLSGGKNFF